MREVRFILACLLAAVLLSADTFKLYLKDGGYHSVREYQVQGDRVRYFSTERGEWEEIPVEMVDLDKTEQEHKATSERVTVQAKQQAEEDKAEREQKREVASIPVEPGAYYKVSEKVTALPSPEYQIVTDKKRRAIQMLSPVPLIPGKASVVIKGEHSQFVVGDERPSFFLRLAKEERFGIISLAPKKGMRIVENISIIPVAKQALEERKQMDTFEQELATGLYRVWPEKALPPGEYALVEYADKQDVSDVELLLWDFAYRAGLK